MFTNYQKDWMEAHNNLFFIQYGKVWVSQHTPEQLACYCYGPDDQRKQPLTKEELDRVNNWWMDKYPTLMLGDFDWVDTKVPTEGLTTMRGEPVYLKMIYGIHPITLHNHKIKKSKYTLPTFPTTTLGYLKDEGIVMERNVKNTIKFGYLDQQGDIVTPYWTIELLKNNGGAKLRYITTGSSYATKTMEIDPYAMSLMCELVTQWDLNIKNGIKIID